MLRRSLIAVFVCVCTLTLIAGCAKEKPADQTAKPKVKMVKLSQNKNLKLTAVSQEGGITDKWEVNLGSSGKISVTHSKGNQASFLGTHNLDEKKNKALWKQIDGIFAGEIASTGAVGVPGDTKYTIILNDEVVGIINLWTADVDKNANIRAFLDDLTGVIEKNTGTNPGL